MELFKDDIITPRTVDDILSNTDGVSNGSTASGATNVGGSQIGGSITGGAYYSNIAGARVEIFPEYDSTIGFASFDINGVTVFKTIIDGTDVGDVIIGDYANGKGMLWDQSLTTFTVKGAIVGSTITGGVLKTSTTGERVTINESNNNAILIYDASDDIRMSLDSAQLTFFGPGEVSGGAIYSFGTNQMTIGTGANTFTFWDYGGLIGPNPMYMKSIYPDTASTYSLGGIGETWTDVYTDYGSLGDLVGVVSAMRDLIDLIIANCCA